MPGPRVVILVEVQPPAHAGLGRDGHTGVLRHPLQRLGAAEGLDGIGTRDLVELCADAHEVPCLGELDHRTGPKNRDILIRLRKTQLVGSHRTQVLFALHDQAGHALRPFRFDHRLQCGAVVALEKLVEIIPGRRLIAVEGKGRRVLFHPGEYPAVERLWRTCCLVGT